MLYCKHSFPQTASSKIGMSIKLQIMFAKGMDLFGVIAEFDEKMDQISWDVFMCVET